MMIIPLVKRKLRAWWYRFRCSFCTNIFVYLSAAAIVLITLYCIGLFDFLGQTDFKEFKWPPYVNVREQVVRELIGESPEYSHLNQWDKLKFVLEPGCKVNRLTRKKSLLIIVKSFPDRLQNRDAIRATWGKIQQMGNWRIQTVFVMGLMEKHNLDKYGDVLHAEQNQFNDLIVGNFQDAYRNNTMKLLYSLKYAQNYCNTGAVPYVFLVDDDYMVYMKNLAAELDRHPPNEHLYMGWRFDTTPFRIVFQKHRVSLTSYPFNKYPPYISAGAVLMTSQTVKEFYLAVQYTKLFPFDDIYAAILAYQLGISPQHNENFRFWAGNPGADPPTTVAAHGYSPKNLLKHFQP